ncbi:MAG: YdcF family protein [Acidimicrobiales bacterium]
MGSLRYPEGRRRLVLRIVLVAVLAGFVYLAVTFGQVWWVSRRDGAREADAAVVLGAAQYDGRPSPVLQDRLDHALGLYEDGLVSVVVVTGGQQEGDRFTEGQVGYLYLRDHGVPDSDILIEDQGTNTWESLAAAARILRNRDLTRAVLVTDGYHALRVTAIADELGLDASVSPSRRGGSVRELLEETGAVAVGRIVGFRRLVNLDDRLTSDTE